GKKTPLGSRGSHVQRAPSSWSETTRRRRTAAWRPDVRRRASVDHQSAAYSCRSGAASRKRNQNFIRPCLSGIERRNRQCSSLLERQSNGSFFVLEERWHAVRDD